MMALGLTLLFIILLLVGFFGWLFIDIFGIGTLTVIGLIVVIAVVIGLIVWFAIAARHKQGVDKP